MLFVTVLAVLVLSPASLTAQDAVKRASYEMHRLHNDPRAHIGALEDPKRDAYRKPQQILTALNLKSGEVVADIGAGSGYFTFRLAHHVGAQGKIYAVDVSPDMIRHINRRIRELKTNNVVSVLGRSRRSVAAGGLNKPLLYLRRMAPRGQSGEVSLAHEEDAETGRRNLMIDFHKKDLPFGPPLQMKIDRNDLIEQLESHGFRLSKEHTFLPYQYFLVLAPT